MAPSNALAAEEIINGFPNPVLPKIDHEPTCEDIQVTTRLLNANAISVLPWRVEDLMDTLGSS
jgi:hypothetical protein